MKYYSLNNPNLKVSFKEAAITGIAPDKGLYFPESLPQLDRSFFENIEKYTKILLGDFKWAQFILFMPTLYFLMDMLH